MLRLETRLGRPDVGSGPSFDRFEGLLERETRGLGVRLTIGRRPGAIGFRQAPVVAGRRLQLLPLVDFASIGSNDLVQFLFASDRGNPKLVGRYDPLSPSALSVMRTIVEKAEQHGKPVTLCGELGGRPLEAMGLIGIGLTSISMVPSAVGAVKAMVLSLDRAKLWTYMQPLLSSPLHSIRPELMEFAQRNGVVWRRPPLRAATVPGPW